MLMAQTEIVNCMFWIGCVILLLFALLAGQRRWFGYALAIWPVLLTIMLYAFGPWSGIRDFINWLAMPERLFLLTTSLLILALMFYRHWTRPLFALSLLGLSLLAYVAMLFDANFFRMAWKSDNIPITLTIFATGYFLWLGLRRMAINDQRIERGKYPAEGHKDDQVLVWPDLMYVELILMVVCTVALIVWSILLRAPLEAPADPSLAPNPAKAPWYFLGLQELLVYFDPWIAGVLLPLLIIVGLCALPYLDRNPKGNGYYTFRERPFAIGIFLFGFIVLWVMPIVIGTFLRGPNWNFYGPFECWDANKAVDSCSVNLSGIFWVGLLGKDLPAAEAWGTSLYYLIREAPCLILLGGYFIFLPWIIKVTVLRGIYKQVGRARYVVISLLLTCMALVPIKMLLHWLFDIKYLVAISEWSLNI